MISHVNSAGRYEVRLEGSDTILALTIDNLLEIGKNPAFPFDKTSFDKTKFKTKLCKNFTTTGACSHGTTCHFAHGIFELDNLLEIGKPPVDGLIESAFPFDKTKLFKTKLCNTFSTTGVCPYGASCHFAHGEFELRHYS